MDEKRRIYGKWSGNEKGREEDPARCIKAVYSPAFIRGMVSLQCKRKRGFGADGLYCKQHAK